MEQERDRSWVVEDPILKFVLDGVKYAVVQNQMTWEEARDNVAKWFPDAEIVVPELEDGNSTRI